MRILIIGAGAVGGYFGAKLHAAGRDVTFLVRPARAEALRSTGLQVISPAHGNLTVQPDLITAPELTAPFDLILLGVKSFALPAAMDDFATAVGPQTLILPQMNGMAHMDALDARFGPQRVLGGVGRISSELDPEGRVVQLSPLQKLLYGERDGTRTPRLQAIHDTLSDAGFDTEWSTDITQAMWDKWTQLATAGALFCLLRGDVGEITATPGGPETARALLAECAATAEACGHRPSAAYLAMQEKAFTQPGSRFSSSMYRDYLAGNPVEADTILADLLHRAEAHTVPTPLLRAATATLLLYGRRRTPSDSAADSQPNPPAFSGGGFW